MPRSGMRWRHVIISTVNSWLPGDPRGFRSRKHKIHSSGDYKHPPPPGEHAGLHAYSKKISGNPVLVPYELRSVVGMAILRKLRKLDYRVLALSVGGMHAHALVELPDDILIVRHIAGQCKTVSSHAIRRSVPGRVWGAGGTYKPVDNARHHRQVFRYILDQEDAWVWSLRDGLPEEEPRRLEDSPPGVDLDDRRFVKSRSTPRSESSSFGGPSAKKKPKKQ